jgi:hypothetical protein
VCDDRYIWTIYKGFIYIQLPSWLWSYGSWIYNYLCNQRLSPLTLWVLIPFRRSVLDTTLCDNKFVSDLRQVCGFLGILRFHPPIKLTTTIWMKYCLKWRKHHDPHPNPYSFRCSYVWHYLLLNNVYLWF